MNTITFIIRPEHYVLPVRHPPNCRCSQHESKQGSGGNFIASWTEAGSEVLQTTAELPSKPKPS